MTGAGHELLLEQVSVSREEGLTRGLDAPNPRYGMDNPPFGPGGAVCSDGEMRVLVLLVDFTDNTASTPAVYFDSLGFATSQFSLSDYYGEISFGTVDIVTVDWPSTTGWLRAPRTYEFYVGGDYGWGPYPGNSQGLVEDLCVLADPLVDFSQYDNDLDGYVDGVNVMFAGTFDGTPQTIWPHAWSLPGAGALHDGVLVSSYSVQSEYNSTPGDASANVLCHEFGHVLGMPDLYDYGYDSNGVGDWCVMSFGVYNGGGWSPAHVCAWNRQLLGLCEPVAITVPGDYELPPVETSGTVYRLWTDGTQGPQYFLVENRRPEGYDSALPSHGALVWHIDEDVTTGNDQQWYPGHTGDGHFLVALEQADGDWDLEQGSNYGDPGDPWPGAAGATEFDYWSIPDSRDYAFEATGVSASGIPPAADTVTIHFEVADLGVEDGGSGTGGISVISNPSRGEIRLTASPDLPGPVVLAMYDMTGRRVAQAAAGTLEDGLRLDVSDLPEGVYAISVEAGPVYFRTVVTVLE
jgi:immune inhibitor A